MFASHNNNQAKERQGSKPERGDSTPDMKTASQHNPLWQSLAMRSGTLQPKLTIGRADDPYEREADRVADQVMRMPASHSDGHALSITPVTTDRAQRKCAECEEEEEEGKLRRRESGGAEAPAFAPPIVHETLSSQGRPLDAATRAYFEPRFGRDFSGVRIHTGGDAVSATHEARARAFTVANQIAFAAGQYEPRSGAGRRLLAHELTHVAQQERLGHSSEKMLMQREPIEGDDACSEPPLMMTEDQGCSLYSYGATTWTMRLSNFETGQHTLKPCHEDALSDFVSKANDQTAKDPEIGEWWINSIIGHASPEGGEKFNENLGLSRAEAVFIKLGELVSRKMWNWRAAQ
jgi:outer membrane protein OmpA-like peptidoglycan-associated protein